MSSQPLTIPSRDGHAGGDSPHTPPTISPFGSPSAHFLVPSPVPCKRTRTYSQSERAMQGPSFHGRIKTFCREKGHGFIVPKDGGNPIFVHISDVDGDFVPKTGDEVKYKAIPIPPKNDKISAVHVSIVHPADGVSHETWEEALHHDKPGHR